MSQEEIGRRTREKQEDTMRKIVARSLRRLGGTLNDPVELDDEEEGPDTEAPGSTYENPLVVGEVEDQGSSLLDFMTPPVLKRAYSQCTPVEYKRKVPIEGVGLFKRQAIEVSSEEESEGESMDSDEEDEDLESLADSADEDNQRSYRPGRACAGKIGCSHCGVFLYHYELIKGACEPCIAALEVI